MATLRSALTELMPVQNSTGNAQIADVIGNKTDTVAGNSVVGQLKLAAQLALAAVTAAELAVTNTYALLETIEDHFHNIGRWFGFASNNLLEGGLTSFQINAGNAARGTELIMYTGTGLPGAYFDFNAIKITAIGSINRLTFIEWYSIIKSAPIAATTTPADEHILKAGHGLIVNDRVMISSQVTSTGLSYYDVYYVGTKDTDWFTLSLTVDNGVPVLLGGSNGSVNYHTLTRSLIGETYINRTSLTPDTFTVPLMAPRVLSTSSVSCVAKAAGGTNTVDFLIGLHTYSV